jgi:isoleucyl-tRNA synthetase
LQKKIELPEGEDFEIVSTMLGSDLIGTTYTHPLYDRNSPVLEGGDYITTESGTGLVHTAPGHGQEDYLTGLKNGLELLSPVDDAGKFTIEAGEEFKGLSVLGEGNTAIIDALTAEGALLKVEDYGHKYPYDWRTKKPTIFRATDQWFASVEGFRDSALKAVDTVSCVVRQVTLDKTKKMYVYYVCLYFVKCELTTFLFLHEFRFNGFQQLERIASTRSS